MKATVYQDGGVVCFITPNYRLVLNMEGVYRSMTVKDFKKMFTVIYHLGADWYDFYTYIFIWDMFLADPKGRPGRNRRDSFKQVIDFNYDRIPAWWFDEAQA